MSARLRGATTGRPRPEPAPTAPSAPVEPVLSVIVPTYNEAQNVPVLLARLAESLAGTAHEIIVVDDDSSDHTWRIAAEVAAGDERVTVIRRVDERGLSSAVLTGMAAAGGRALVVMDADLQHDETKIPDLVRAIVEDGVDVCLGSRDAQGGSYGGFRRRRRLVSWTGAALARALLGVPVSDPMSGFFAVSRDRFDLVRDEINPRGFKILLEFLARGPKPSVAEVGYRFGSRLHGSTKLNGSVGLAYLVALLGLMVHRVRRRLRR